VTGFPNDLKERELNNMLRFMPGYEASQVYWKNGQVRPVVAAALKLWCHTCRAAHALLQFPSFVLRSYADCTALLPAHLIGTRLCPVLCWSSCTCRMHCTCWTTVGTCATKHTTDSGLHPPS
jgi:hypothetical protein